MKIAEKQEGGVGGVLKTVGIGAAGGALGYGAAELLGRKLKYFQPVQHPMTEAAQRSLRNRTTAARIILPILSGAAVMLADRYRQRMNEEYSKIRGYRPETR